MMKSREHEACAVFEDKIVVSGGTIWKPGKVYLNSIETYYYHENKWSSFPTMLSPRKNHSAVSIGNKMFIIESGSTYLFGVICNFEVIDS